MIVWLAFPELLARAVAGTSCLRNADLLLIVRPAPESLTYSRVPVHVGHGDEIGAIVADVWKTESSSSRWNVLFIVAISGTPNDDGIAGSTGMIGAMANGWLNEQADAIADVPLFTVVHADFIQPDLLVGGR